MSTPQEQLKAVLDQIPAAAAAPAQPRPAMPKPAVTSTLTRERQRTSSLLRQLGESLAALAVLALAGAMWYAGAVFTLVALAAIGIPLERLGLWQWGIPAGISLIELFWWPRDGSPAKLSVFVAIAGVDLLSTLYGLLQWSAGLFIPIGTGYALPKEGAGLLVPATVFSLVLTFAPERLAVWSLRELRAIWRG